MRAIAESLKIIGAVGMATILGYPATFPPPGLGLVFFLATFTWPLLFAPLLLGLGREPVAILLRVLEIPLLGWTGFMCLFAAGMEPGTHTYILVGGAVVYTLGAFLADILSLRKPKQDPA